MCADDLNAGSSKQLGGCIKMRHDLFMHNQQVKSLNPSVQEVDSFREQLSVPEQGFCTADV